MTKNTTGKVPKTKVEPPKVIKLTKSQKELFVTRQQQSNEGAQEILKVYNAQVGINLGKLIDEFIEELGIDVEGEDWSFDANTLQFKREEKKEKK